MGSQGGIVVEHIAHCTAVQTETQHSRRNMADSPSGLSGSSLGNWGSTINQLEDKSSDGALLSATSKALKAALFENDELRNLNADLESRLLQ